MLYHPFSNIKEIMQKKFNQESESDERVNYEN